MEMRFRAPRGIGGEIVPPADKSLTHRAFMLAAIADGESRVSNPLETGDCLSTRRCVEALGAVCEGGRGAGRPSAGGGAREVTIRGLGLRGLREPAGVLDAENSGTSMRLLSGLLAGLPLFAVMTGDSSLRRRPMARVVEPLRSMGARIEGREGGKLAPLCFLPGGGSLSPISYALPVASAQVKSAILLAALRAEGTTRIQEAAGSSRDHTERLLSALGVPLKAERGTLEVTPVPRLPSFSFEVPGDISSASFFLAAALISGHAITVTGCGINPTRLGFLSVLRRMGASIEVAEDRSSLGEPIGSIRASPAPLSAAAVESGEVPDLIDEIPLVAVLGLFARGRTEVRGAAELKHKESDRLAMIGRLVESFGGRIEISDEGFAVEGPQALRAGTVDPMGDHRIAMAAAVAGAGIPAGVRVKGFEAAQVSYPDFIDDFRRLGGIVE
jgi:3-phosphoshikimate 1-carboxyvinyltransferase